MGSSSSAGYERRSAEREAPELRAKRTASAQGLDRSNEGGLEGMGMRQEVGLCIIVLFIMQTLLQLKCSMTLLTTASEINNYNS